MLTSVFNEFAILMALSVFVSFIAIKMKQPLILSFIVVGIIAGPAFLGWITSHNQLEVLASFGITLLLFIVGLKLDLHHIRSFGAVALIVGMGQIALTTFLGWLLGIACGMSGATALFVALTITFSSTIIVVKVLSDNFEIDSLYGRLSIGILIVQDLVVVLMIIVLSSLNLGSGDPTHLFYEIVSLGLKGFGFLAVLALVMRFILPTIIESLAKSRELLVLFAIAWAVILAVISESLGFGKEVGGFLAGVSLASTRYRDAITSRLDTVRNLLLLFFFLNLGSSLQFESIDKAIVPAILFSIFVLIAKPLIIMIMMGLAGFRKRTGFLAGLSLGQISEFSLILAALGLDLHYIDVNTEGLITFVGLVTIGVSTYLIAYANTIYCWAAPYLRVFERQSPYREAEQKEEVMAPVDVIIYGFGRHGKHMATVLKDLGLRVMAIDFDPRGIRSWQHDDILLRYGDAEDVDFAKSLPLRADQWVVSTIPHLEANQAIVSSLRELNYAGKIAISAYHEHELSDIDKLNVDLVLVPFRDAAMNAAERIAELMQGRRGDQA